MWFIHTALHRYSVIMCLMWSANKHAGRESHYASTSLCAHVQI